jgi:hypothetical protein
MHRHFVVDSITPSQTKNACRYPHFSVQHKDSNAKHSSARMVLSHLIESGAIGGDEFDRQAAFDR